MTQESAKMNAQYIDRYNRVWIRVSEYTVWNADCGYGVWDKGKGLMAA